MTTDINAMLRDLARSRFYGSIEVKLEDGKIVLIRKTENYKPPMGSPGYARTKEL
ncbi:MAG: YezD family protein [Acidobacteriia bacterium]|nr:YezD family protein [Terriglobia bacterium]